MFSKIIFRDPGDAGSASVGAQGGAGDAGAAGAAGDGSGASAPQYVSKSDFDSFQNEFRETVSRLTPREQAQADRQQGGSDNKAPTEPNPKDYKFDQPGELNRYNRDNYTYFRHMDRAEESKANESKAAQENERKIYQAHEARVAEYRKANPAYDTDMKSAGNVLLHEPILKAIFASKGSAEVSHYLFKNKAEAQDLNLTFNADGIDAVRERIGEIKALINAEKKALEGNTNAAKARPPRQDLRAAASGSQGGNRSNAKDFEFFHS